MFTSTTFIFLLVTVWTVSAEVDLGCKQGWTLYGDHCFYVGRGYINTYEAYLECKDMEADLGDSYRRLDGIKFVLENTNSSGVTGAWVSEKTNYSWKFGRLDFQRCTIVDAEKDMQLRKLPCGTDDVEMLYVCEDSRIVLKDCFGSSCYTLSYNWKYTCENGRGYLARIESLEESQFVAEFLKNASSMADFRDPIYINGNDNATEGLWVYSNGDKMTFFNWAEDKSNINNDGDDCIVIQPGSYDWDDFECGASIHYLCEEDNIDMSW